MKEEKIYEFDQGRLLAILQSAYQKGEKSIINNPKEMIEEMISQMRSIGSK